MDLVIFYLRYLPDMGWVPLFYVLHPLRTVGCNSPRMRRLPTYKELEVGANYYPSKPLAPYRVAGGGRLTPGHLASTSRDQFYNNCGGGTLHHAFLPPLQENIATSTVYSE